MLLSLLSVLSLATLILGQGQQCYFGKGAENRGPAELVPCNGTGSTSACCLQGDTCISGNACYNYATGNLYQYGCTDINYEDSTCPYKCGSKSPWVALEYCGTDTIQNTWVCHSPESCGCEWDITYQLLTLQGRQCQDMGDLALVGLYAPTALAPWVSLPPTAGGSTGYYSPTTISGTKTWISTAIDGYTPTPIVQLTTYKPGPSSKITIFPGSTPGPATYLAAETLNATTATTQSDDGSSSITTGGPSGSTATSSSSSSATSGSSSSSRSIGSGSSSTTIASVASSPVTSSVSPSASTSGLSSGAKVGIGVGAGVGGLALIGLIAACIMARRIRERRVAHEQNMQQSPAYSQPSPLGMPPQYPNQHPVHGFGWAPHPSGSFHQQYDASKVYYSASPSPPIAPTELANSEVRDAHELDSEISGITPQASPKPVGRSSLRRLPS